MAKWLKLSLTVGIIFIGLPLLGLSLIWKDSCKTNVVREHPSPGGDVFVRELVTDCGAKIEPALVLEFARNATNKKWERILVAKGAKSPTLAWNDPEKKLGIELPVESVLAYDKKALLAWTFVVSGGAPPKTHQ